MRAYFFLLLALGCLFVAGCNNQYGDDPTKQGLALPASTPVPTATPLPEK